MPDQRTRDFPKLQCEPGARFGAWTVIQADRTGWRITVICDCRQMRQVSRAALENGESLGCGCAATPRARATPRPEPTFRLPDWRPQR
jgi:hypothetical protein